jgi:hypothetical protein
MKQYSQEGMKMKKTVLGIILVVVLTSVFTLNGCIRRDISENNGPITTQSYDNTGFTGVDIGSALKFEITAGDSYNVTITAGKNLFERIKVEQTGNMLKISTEGWNIGWWWGHITPKVSITMPGLQKLYVSGASDGTVSGFISDEDFTLKVSGASRLDIDMTAGAFKAEISGASNVNGRLTAVSSGISISGASDLNITGSGGNIQLEGSGASTASLRYFEVNDAEIVFSGASNGSITVSGILDVTLSGASSLNYYGNPVLGNTNITGASDLKHKIE